MELRFKVYLVARQDQPEPSELRYSETRDEAHQKFMGHLTSLPEGSVSWYEADGDIIILCSNEHAIVTVKFVVVLPLEEKLQFLPILRVAIAHPLPHHGMGQRLDPMHV